MHKSIVHVLLLLCNQMYYISAILLQAEHFSVAHLEMGTCEVRHMHAFSMT